MTTPLIITNQSQRVAVVYSKAAMGPPGISGSASTTYVHLQPIPATTWTIAHSLGYNPNVSVFEEGTDDQIEGFTINHVSIYSLTLTFAITVAGKAILS